MGTPSRLSRTTKTTKGTTRVPEISHLRAGSHSKMKWRRIKQCRSTSMSMITTSQELHRWASATGFVLAQGTHQAEEQRENFFRLMSPLSKDETGRGYSPVQFLWCCDHRHACWSTLFYPSSFHFAMAPRPEVRYLWYPCGSLGGFCSSWQSTWGPHSFVLLTRNTRLAWCLCMMSVCKFCSPSLHCLIWFSRCSSAWWVPWARTKPVADAHLCNFCDVVIIDMLVDRHCFILLHLKSFIFQKSFYLKKDCHLEEKNFFGKKNVFLYKKKGFLEKKFFSEKLTFFWKKSLFLEKNFFSEKLTFFGKKLVFWKKIFFLKKNFFCKKIFLTKKLFFEKKIFLPLAPKSFGA